MKKIIKVIIISLSLFFIVAVANAENAIPSGISKTLNVTTYVQIVNSGPECDSFVVWVDDCTGWTYADDSAGLNAVVVSSDVGCSMTFSQKVKKNQTVFWVKATTGTPEFYFQGNKK